MRSPRFFDVPKFSLIAHIIGVIFVCVVSSLIIAFKLHGSNLKETAISTSVLLAFLWAYFSSILFYGWRFDHGIIAWRRPRIDFSDIGDAVKNSDIDLSSIPLSFDAGEGCLGVVMSLVLSVVVFFALIILVYVGVEIGLLIALIIAIPMYWIIRYSARLVIVNRKQCEGHRIKSILVGMKYAVPYAALMGIVFYVINSLTIKNS